MRTKRIITALMLAVGLVSFASHAVVNRNLSTDSQGIRMVADSIDYRSDLTRLYGHLIGAPHTSQRIDSVILESSGVPFGATDIDGVDFERWFQWEDDGSIAVEIDFPAMKPVRKATVKANGPRGTSVWVIVAE